MNFDIGIAVFNQKETTEKMIKSVLETSGDPHEIIIFDNGSTEDLKTLGVFTYLRSEKNVGIFQSYNAIAEKSQNQWIAFMHNDILIHETKWDRRIEDTLDQLNSQGRKVGIFGFSGSRGADEIGARIGFASNLRDVAEVHGQRIKEYMPAVMLDGAVLICRKEMLGRVGGFDQTYKIHHLYDYDISMASISAGYYNIVMGIDFTHIGGITACRGDAQLFFEQRLEEDMELYAHRELLRKINPAVTAEQTIMDYNIKVFRRKWVGRGILPLYYSQDFIKSTKVERV